MLCRHTVGASGAPAVNSHSTVRIITVRKTTTLLSVAVVATSLAACGSSGSSSVTTPTGGAASSAAQSSGATGSSSSADAGESSGTTGSSAAASGADNGIASLSADQIRSKAAAAMRAAPSLYMTLSSTSSGKRISYAGNVGSSPLRCDLNGTIDSGKFSMRVVGGNTYIKGDAAAFEAFASASSSGSSSSGATMSKLLNGRWLKSSGTSSASFCNMQTLFPATAGSATLTKGSTTTVDGTPAIELQSSGTSSGTTKIYIATTGQPYVLKMDNTGSQNGKASFSKFGDPVTVSAPPASQVLDSSSLGRAASSSAAAS